VLSCKCIYCDIDMIYYSFSISNAVDCFAHSRFWLVTRISIFDMSHLSIRKYKEKLFLWTIAPQIASCWLFNSSCSLSNPWIADLCYFVSYYRIIKATYQVSFCIVLAYSYTLRVLLPFVIEFLKRAYCECHILIVSITVSSLHLSTYTFPFSIIRRRDKRERK
jgi:hypothetical protein